MYVIAKLVHWEIKSISLVINTTFACFVSKYLSFMSCFVISPIECNNNGKCPLRVRGRKMEQPNIGSISAFAIFMNDDVRL